MFGEPSVLMGGAKCVDGWSQDNLTEEPVVLVRGVKCIWWEEASVLVGGAKCVSGRNQVC